MSNINRYVTVAGVAVYAAPDGIVQEQPCAVDSEVTLATISHPTTTINMMGSYDVADTANVDNVQVTISCQSVIEAMELLKHESFVARFAMLTEDASTGLSDYTGFTAYFSGHVQSSGGGTAGVGSAADSTIVVNCSKYRLLQGSVELINIDRLRGTLVIMGVDKRSKLNKLLEGR